MAHALFLSEEISDTHIKIGAYTQTLLLQHYTYSTQRLSHTQNAHIPTHCVYESTTENFNLSLHKLGTSFSFYQTI